MSNGTPFFILYHKVIFFAIIIPHRRCNILEARTFLSLLHEKLLRLGLDDIRAREEVSTFRNRMNSDPRLNNFVVRATSEDVAQMAERIYAGIIVRSNSPERGESAKYGEMAANIVTENFPVQSPADKAEEARLDFEQRTDYIGSLWRKLKKKIDRNPASRAWIAVIIPLVIILTALITALFAGAWLALAALLVGLFALTCAIAVGGTVVSVAGIIYGVVQLFTGAAPIGWYEIGLGVIIIGMTIFSGVVFFNCSVRFVPIFMRQLGSLLRIFFRKVLSEAKTAKGVLSQK